MIRKSNRGGNFKWHPFWWKVKTGLNVSHTHTATNGGSESKAVYGFNEFSCEAEILSMTGCHFISASKGNDLKGVEPLLAKHRPLLSVALARKEKGCLFSQWPLYQQLSWEINECLHLAPLSKETKNSESAEKGSFHGATEYKYCWELFTVSESVTLAAKSWKKKFFYSSSCSWFISSIMRLIKLWASAGTASRKCGDLGILCVSDLFQQRAVLFHFNLAHSFCSEWSHVREEAPVITADVGGHVTHIELDSWRIHLQSDSLLVCWCVTGPISILWGERVTSISNHGHENCEL